MGKKIICITLLCLWMAVIFCFSAQSAQNSLALSNKVKEKIVTVVKKVIPGLKLENKSKLDKAFITVTRKAAHFFCFCILGILAFLNCLVWQIKKYPGVLALLFSFLYAVTDELHQMFVPGRGCRALDVLIDTIGAGLGVFLLFLVHTMISRKKQKNT